MLLEKRWIFLMTRLTGRAPHPDIFTKLVTAYSEPHRHYHNQDHIALCLQELDKNADLAEFPDIIEFALWLHDSVYDTAAHDNEIKSAEWASDILTISGCGSSVSDTVHALILDTAHGARPLSKDGALIVDIDLCILGKSRDIFDDYESAIRQEYIWVPEELYKKGRADVLTGFLERPRIYYTDRIEAEYGETARENLKHSLAMLNI
jgi:predicted metal-dependent HD superfamily phosphohydrolase